LPVGLMGLILWFRGQRRTGVLTMAAAAGWLFIALGIIRPLFAPAHAEQSHVTFSTYLTFYFADESQVLISTAVQRLFTAVLVFAPGLWLGRYAWYWSLPGIAVAVPALLSPRGPAYDYRFHHYALVVPFLVVATVYGAGELRRKQAQENPGKRHKDWRKELGMAVAITLLLSVLMVDTPLNPTFWIGNPNRGTSSWRYGREPRDAFKDRWLAEYVPKDASLAASEFLTNHLINRPVIYVFRNEEPQVTNYLDEVEYVVADALFDWNFVQDESTFLGGVLRDTLWISRAYQHPSFDLTVAQDGMLLFQRDADPGDGLAQTYQTYAWDGAASDLQHDFGELIGLLSAEIEPMGGRRFRFTFAWVMLQPLQQRPALFAVSELKGIPQNRIVHLPTHSLYPTTAWKPGQVIEEQFEVVFASDIPSGSYQLLTGWYDGGSIFSAATDERSRIGEEYLIETIKLE
jgi:hypothetical protein